MDLYYSITNLKHRGISKEYHLAAKKTNLFFREIRFSFNAFITHRVGDLGAEICDPVAALLQELCNTVRIYECTLDEVIGGKIGTICNIQYTAVISNLWHTGRQLTPLQDRQLLGNQLKQLAVLLSDNGDRAVRILS